MLVVDAAAAALAAPSVEPAPAKSEAAVTNSSGTTKVNAIFDLLNDIFGRRTRSVGAGSGRGNVKGAPNKVQPLCKVHHLGLPQHGALLTAANCDLAQLVVFNVLNNHVWKLTDKVGQPSTQRETLDRVPLLWRVSPIEP
ncbi:hypothetical protein AWC22_03490 [Mycobacterium riyadhense]|uniref:Uncharacterized protein n=1 Tax=Mycobacterium riyadhense TaxID=486698 RepID=A0A1X2BII5_9MYCO|nr:hypothetical protein AWC22_03490 [Mycobacterium riyadhense]